MIEKTDHQSGDVSHAREGVRAFNDKKIPLLTEVVTIRSSPVRSILDTALGEVSIDMSARDREILARSLEKQLKDSSIYLNEDGIEAKSFALK